MESPLPLGGRQALCFHSTRWQRDCPLPGWRCRKGNLAECLPGRSGPGPASRFAGPRSSPTVADGKVVTLGAPGTISCLAADTGKLLCATMTSADWCRGLRHPVHRLSRVAWYGSGWKRSGRRHRCVRSDHGNLEMEMDQRVPAYGSPVLITVGNTEAIVTPTATKMVALAVADGQLLWEIPYTQGRYNAATPIILGRTTVVYAGPNRGITAERIEKDAADEGAETLEQRGELGSVQHARASRRPSHRNLHHE